ncbi:MAG: outer membrane protein assembly factor BamB family protein [Armatimonadota bacterium]
MGATGPKWVFDAEQYRPGVLHAVDCAPCIGVDGSVVVGDHGGVLWALSPQDGTPVWSIDLQGAIGWSSPTVGPDGLVYVGTFTSRTSDGGGRLFSITAGGSYRWQFAFTGTPLDSPPSVGPDGRLYVAAFDGSLYCLSPQQDGAVIAWFRVLSSAPQVVSAPAFARDGSTLYIGTLDAELVALRTADGSEVWRVPVDAEVYATPAVASDGTIYAATFAGSVYAVRPDGTVLWATTPDGAGEIKASPAIGRDGSVYAATRSGRLYRLDGKDGRVLWVWQSDTGGRINSSPVVDAEGNAYFGSEDGCVYAVGADGRLLWRYDVGSLEGNMVNSSPALSADGTLYVGTQHGMVYAFAAPPSIAYGDINADGRVDVKDVTLVLGYVLAGRPLTDEQFTAADVAPAGAPDGRVSIGDAVRILRRAVGIEPAPWP